MSPETHHLHALSMYVTSWIVIPTRMCVTSWTARPTSLHMPYQCVLQTGQQYPQAYTPPINVCYKLNRDTHKPTHALSMCDTSWTAIPTSLHMPYQCVLQAEQPYPQAYTCPINVCYKLSSNTHKPTHALSMCVTSRTAIPTSLHKVVKHKAGYPWVEAIICSYTESQNEASVWTGNKQTNKRLFLQHWILYFCMESSEWAQSTN